MTRPSCVAPGFGHWRPPSVSAIWQHLTRAVGPQGARVQLVEPGRALNHGDGDLPAVWDLQGRAQDVVEGGTVSPKDTLKS